MACLPVQPTVAVNGRTGRRRSNSGTTENTHTGRPPRLGRVERITSSLIWGLKPFDRRRLGGLTDKI